MTQEFQTAEFCGTDASPLDSSTYLIDGCDTLSESADDTGWGDNFNAGLFSYNTSTLVGNYGYVWSAGNDPQTRRLNVVIEEENSDRVGRAYYGFGDRIATVEGSTCTAFSDYILDGIVCNWVGPQGYLTAAQDPLPQFTQRQSMTRDSSTGQWSVSSEQIIYAPTNNCQCDGACTLTYQAQGATDYSNDDDQAGPQADADGFDLESFTDYEADFTAPTAPTF
jgi:hypothetical protein